MAPRTLGGLLGRLGGGSGPLGSGTGSSRESCNSGLLVVPSLGSFIEVALHGLGPVSALLDVRFVPSILPGLLLVEGDHADQDLGRHRYQSTES